MAAPARHSRFGRAPAPVVAMILPPGVIMVTPPMVKASSWPCPRAHSRAHRGRSRPPVAMPPRPTVAKSPAPAHGRSKVARPHPRSFRGRSSRARQCVLGKLTTSWPRLRHVCLL
ncbi:hypothetical protein ZWY2020_013418 [Hordeum vulgare]|nr:hypothetical protein ZWY2020_013418 [Hordeum vulgare]